MLLALNAYEGLRYLYVVFGLLFDMSYIKYHVIDLQTGHYNNGCY